VPFGGAALVLAVLLVLGMLVMLVMLGDLLTDLARRQTFRHPTMITTTSSRRVTPKT
jgi:hypothetical protein